MAVRIADTLKQQNDLKTFPVAFSEDIWIDKNKGEGGKDYANLQELYNEGALGGGKNFSTAPIGTVLSFAGHTAPHSYLLCNGASYKVADYPDLYAVIGNTYGGDSTNFNVPNLVDKFVQGSTTSGTEKEAGLPNITGGFYSYSYFNGTPSGAITTSVENRNQTQSGGDNMRTYIHCLLDASRSNSIYGNSDTVQPPALTMVYIIKAFHTNEGVDSGVSDDVKGYVSPSLVYSDTGIEVYRQVSTYTFNFRGCNLTTYQTAISTVLNGRHLPHDWAAFISRRDAGNNNVYPGTLVVATDLYVSGWYSNGSGVETQMSMTDTIYGNATIIVAD